MKILITGGAGFLGLNCAKKAKRCGYYVIGAGFSRGTVLPVNYDEFYSGQIQPALLEKIKSKPDVIIHCAGGSSVGVSVSEPYIDFERTVQSSAVILEYMRTKSPKSKLIYISSAAVYGEHDNTSIHESDKLSPASPYGVYKKIVEDLILSYHKQYNLDFNIIRLFSVYGAGLKKQLIWDICNKFKNHPKEIELWGTGFETRDFIHVDDAVDLIFFCMANMHNKIINGGSGHGILIEKLVNKLKVIYNYHGRINFNQNQKSGDPKFFWANMAYVDKWQPLVDLDTGLHNYVSWFKANHVTKGIDSDSTEKN